VGSFANKAKKYYQEFVKIYALYREMGGRKPLEDLTEDTKMIGYLKRYYQELIDSPDSLKIDQLLGKQIADGLEKTNVGISAGVDKLSQTAIDAIKDSTQQDLGKDLGKDFSSGYGLDIIDGNDTVREVASGLAKSALEAIAEMQRSNSPSLECGEKGENLVDVYTELGIKKSTNKITEAVSDLAKKCNRSIRKGSGKSNQ
jgi:hypothetical protein